MEHALQTCAAIRGNSKLVAYEVQHLLVHKLGEQHLKATESR